MKNMVFKTECPGETPALQCRPMTEADKYAIGRWRYEGEYSLYNSVPYDEQKSKGTGLANGENNLFSFLEGGKLVGYVNLKERGDRVNLGVAAAPDCCGMGYGTRMTIFARKLSRELFGEKPLTLEVRSWNRRAIRCYEKAGFVPEGEPFLRTTPLGEGLFIRMRERETG